MSVTWLDWHSGNLFWYNQKSWGVREFSMFRGGVSQGGIGDFILYIISCVDYNSLLMFINNVKHEKRIITIIPFIDKLNKL